MNLPDVPPAPPTRGRRRAALVGAAVGAVTLAAVVAGVGVVGAGAQTDDPSHAPPEELQSTDAPIDDDWHAFDQCMADRLGGLWMEPHSDDIEFGFPDDPDNDLEPVGDFDDPELELHDLEPVGDFDDPEPFDEATLEAWEEADAACAEQLPREIQEEMAAWGDYDRCLDGQLGFTDDTGGQEPGEISEAEWDAADRACRAELPPELQEELSAFDDVDECLRDSGVLFAGDFGSVVHVEGPDGFSMIEFGSSEGTVTVSGTDDGVTVSTSGDVTLLTEADLDRLWEAEEAAFDACEWLLPDDGFGFEVVPEDRDG